MKTRLCIAGICLLFAVFSFGQTKYTPEKWGNIPTSDLTMTLYPADSAAGAVILQDIGTTTVQYRGDKFIVLYTRHRRIKIFDAAALKEGNLLIPYYSYRGTEKMTNLDVLVISPDGTKQKVSAENVFTEKLSKHVSAKKVFIPNLRKGSIIEYRYNIQSEDIAMLNAWQFQGDLPMRYSEHTLTVPKNFSYTYLLNSSRPLDVNESGIENEITEGGGRIEVLKTFMAMYELPAITEEPYITTLDDYKCQIHFQLQNLQYTSGQIEEFMTSWSKLADRLSKHTGFGLQYQRQSNFSQVWSAFKHAYPDDIPAEELPEKVLHFVASNIQWNGDYRVIVDKSIDDAYAKKQGSSAEINLALVALLRKSGADAVPVLVSTRDNGAMFPNYPFVEQFNSVVVLLRRGDQIVLLDATDPFLSVNELRPNHYNAMGWIVDEKSPDWADITPVEYNESWFGRVKLSEDGVMSGHFTISASGRAATEWRSAWSSENSEKVIREKISSETAEVAIDSISITGLESFGKPVQADFYCAVPGQAEAVNDFLYAVPVLDFFLAENPFKSPERRYPVNFTFPLKMQYVLVMELPAGYEPAELPPAARINLPDNGGKITFSCTSMEGSNALQVILKISLAQTDFPTEQYGALRQFFELFIEKSNTQLVLKKQ